VCGCCVDSEGLYFKETEEEEEEEEGEEEDGEEEGKGSLRARRPVREK
jgi:hypothetical protein